MEAIFVSSEVSHRLHGYSSLTQSSDKAQVANKPNTPVSYRYGDPVDLGTPFPYPS